MHEYSIALRISGLNLIPDEITVALALQPTNVIRVGEYLSKNRIAALSSWTFEVRPPDGTSWKDLEHGLNSLLDQIEDRAAQIHEFQQEFEVCLWCGHFSSSFDGGPTFSPVLFRRLGVLRIPLFLDTYFSDSGSE